MKISDILSSAAQAGLAWTRMRLLGHRVPFLISWNLTFRCNLSCVHCGCRHLDIPELSTDQIRTGLSRLYSLGARWITFSGGEPLLRDDIGDIISCAKYLGFRVFLSTNGILLPEKIGQLKKVDRVTLSLDGMADAHDAVRGTGSFACVEKACLASRRAGIDVAFMCTLTDYNNLDSIDGLIEFARRNESRIMFQPATLNMDSSFEKNPVASGKRRYRRVVRHIMAQKQCGAPIGNSLSGLRHLLHWPHNRSIRCSAGKFVWIVEPDGRILACHQAQKALLYRNGTNGNTALCCDDFAGNLSTCNSVFARHLEVPSPCYQCWCAPLVEINLLSGLDLNVILNVLQYAG